MAKENPQGNKTDQLTDYFKNHAQEAISYALLVLGIILLFFEPFYGGVIVGVVAGVYFSSEIISYVTSWKLTFNEIGVARNLIFAGVAIAFFISAPAIFLGAAVAIGIKQLFLSQK